MDAIFKKMTPCVDTCVQSQSYSATFLGGTHFSQWLKSKTYYRANPDDARGGLDWAGGTIGQTVARAEMGQQELVAASDAFLSRIEETTLEAHTHAIVPSVAGGAFNLGAHLAGHPLSMRARRRVVSDLNPICILSDHFFSAAVPEGHIRRRGAAILALVRVLCRMRPVSLYATIAIKSAHTLYAAIPVETAPLDLTRAAWLLAGPDVLRNGFHSVLGELQGDVYKGGFPPANGAMNAPKLYTETFRRLLGFDDAITIPGFHGTDAEFWKSDDTAIRWVNDTVATMAGLEGLQAA